MPHVNSNGCRIWWEEEGHGEPVLAIMGLGFSREMWFRTAPVVSKHFRLIRFDNRGIGLSDSPKGPYLMKRMAADAAAVMQAAGETSAHILGASMGGMIAQELALRHPDRVRSLTLGCTWCGGLHAVRPDVRRLQALRAKGASTPEARMRALVPLIYTDATPPERIDEDIRVRMQSLPTGQGYFAQLMGTLLWSSWSRLPRIQHPVKLIHGECDRLIPVANVDVLMKRLPDARQFIVPGAGHVFSTDEPELSNRAVLEFLLEMQDRDCASVRKSNRDHGAGKLIQH